MGFLGTIALVFSLVAIGYLAARSGLVGKGVGEALGDFVFSVAIPVLLFRTLSEASFDGVAPLPVWSAYFLPVAITWVLAATVARRAFGRDPRGGVVAGVASSFSNTVLVGIPLIQILYGDEGFAILALILTVHLPIMMAASIVLFDLATAREDAGKSSIATMTRQFVRGMVRSPLLYGIVGGSLWRITGWEMPALPAAVIEQIAGVAGTLALVSLGMSLNRFGIARNVPQGSAVALAKLLVMPACAAVFALLLDLPAPVAQVVIVLAAMPTGVNPYLIAARFGTGEALASNAMVISTLVAPLTLAFWIWLAASLT